jgi:hypothetical protein
VQVFLFGQGWGRPAILRMWATITSFQISGNDTENRKKILLHDLPHLFQSPA